MSSKFIDMLFGIVMRFKWKHIAAMLAVSFCTSWWLMSYFEPKADIVKPSVYWWYFLMDVLRGGYSGYQPASIGGRLVALFSFFGSGICFVAAICKTVGYAYEHLQKKRKGLIRMKKDNHVVLLGFRAGESDELIQQLTADRGRNKPVVLCSKRVQENPHPDKVQFIHGNTSSDDVMERANVSKADVVVINGHDTDDRTLAVAIAALARAKKDAHIVVYFESEENARILKNAYPHVECVTSLRPMLLAQAVCNPGSTQLIHRLVSLEDPGTNYRIDVPSWVPETSFHLALTILNMEYRAILLGYADSHSCDGASVLNPPQDTRIKGGMALFYVAQYPINDIIDWTILQKASELDTTAVAI